MQPALLILRGLKPPAMFLSIDRIGHQTIGLRPKAPWVWAAGAIVTLQLVTEKPAGYQSEARAPGRRDASAVSSPGESVPDGDLGHAPPSGSNSPSPPNPQGPTEQSDPNEDVRGHAINQQDGRLRATRPEVEHGCLVMVPPTTDP